MSIIFRSPLRTLCLVGSEAILTYISGMAALYLRFVSEWRDVFFNQRGWAKIIVLILVVEGSFYLFDLYELRSLSDPRKLQLSIIQATGLSAIVLAFIFYVFPQTKLGHGVFLLSLMLMLGLMTFWRLFATWILAHPRFAERVLIIGTGPSAVSLAAELLQNHKGRFKVVGFVGDDPQLLGKSLINPSVVGLVSDLGTVVRAHRSDRLIVALEDERGKLPLEQLLALKLSQQVTIEESPTFYERLNGKISTKGLRPSWLIFSSNSRQRRIYARFRRLADIVLAFIGLTISLPVMIVTAIAIKLDSPGPVFYRQERVGRGNQIFKIIKFRSMKVTAEMDGPVWASKIDSRVTRIGRIIRKLRIDEIPQFLNILHGEMTFIGPRPERPEFVQWLEREIEYYSQRHLVKPGLTGWAQICYQYGASLEESKEKLEYDLYYIKNQSPLLDAVILLETAKTIIFGKGAR
ncbi:MAG TPA: TIGR03013 family XrtA/PEP-CTERM system glycosyltransferase [Blastocatellia bacterium]|nr:TIGR03013 family XrtA/PEP-CTERM system glycosyltransferase [Blastocatellia bacterium]